MRWLDASSELSVRKRKCRKPLACSPVTYCTVRWVPDSYRAKLLVVLRALVLFMPLILEWDPERLGKRHAAGQEVRSRRCEGGGELQQSREVETGQSGPRECRGPAILVAHEAAAAGLAAGLATGWCIQFWSGGSQGARRRVPLTPLKSSFGPVQNPITVPADVDRDLAAGRASTASGWPETVDWSVSFSGSGRCSDPMADETVIALRVGDRKTSLFARPKLKPP